jgi:hypothetical protein
MTLVEGEFERVRWKSTSAFNDRKLSNSWAAYADALLDYYDQLMDLEGILVGQERMKREPYNNRFGVPTQHLKVWKKIQGGDW